MPKGVMYPQGELTDRMLAAFGVLGVDVPVPTDRATIAPFVRAMASRGADVTIPCCPVMHGTGMWGSVMPAHLSGGTVVLLESRSFDADEVWTLTETEAVTKIVIVGDPFARPMLRALEAREGQGHPYDVSSVRSIVSAGAIWSAEIKDGLRARMSALLVDALGSTEGGTYATSTATHDTGAPTAHFTLSADTKVVTEDGREVTPGSSDRGLLASRTGAFGYYKDPEKSARTFVHLDGKSYVMTGDWATVDGDGAITLLGRGSICINSGGEKIFPEEVEEAIKRHPRVDDCLVVGTSRRALRSASWSPSWERVAMMYRQGPRSSTSFAPSWRITRFPRSWSCATLCDERPTGRPTTRGLGRQPRSSALAGA